MYILRENEFKLNLKCKKFSVMKKVENVDSSVRELRGETLNNNTNTINFKYSIENIGFRLNPFIRPKI